MGAHIPDKMWTARSNGQLVGTVRTIDENNVEVMIVDGDEEAIFEFTRDDLGQLMRRIRECLELTGKKGRLNPKRQAEMKMLADRALARQNGQTLH